MIVDLRSDTVTKPTPEMYEAMRNAELGDDVLGDDPTVIALEKLAAEKMGKPAAMFVPSGTMGNQIGVKTWTQPGEAILVEQEAHILFYESGGPGAVSGVVTFTFPSKNGVPDLENIKDRVTVGSIHTPATKLLCLENTHNRAGGAVIPIDLMKQFRDFADEHGMKVHLDGARIFNAAHALNVQAKEIAKYADSVMFCLSKGLSCPVGSLLVGPEDYISEAKRHRKRMGGTMRQSGILAACGIYALNNLTERLKEDHARAKTFADFVNNLNGFKVDLDNVQTNIVMVDTEKPAKEISDKLYENDVWCFAIKTNRLRCVFHREIDDEKNQRAMEVFESLSN